MQVAGAGDIDQYLIGICRRGPRGRLGRRLTDPHRCRGPAQARGIYYEEAVFYDCDYALDEPLCVHQYGTHPRTHATMAGQTEAHPRQ